MLPRHDAHSYVRRGVVARVHAPERVGDHALAQIALRIAAPHTLLHGALKLAAADVHVLAQLYEHGHKARVLADRQARGARRVQVGAEV